MLNNKTKIFLAWLILLATAASANAADTIRVAYSSVNPHALLVSMAEKRGLYAKYGIASTVIYVSGGSTVVQAMVGGDIDLGQLTGAPGVIANLRGADLVYIAMSDDKMGNVKQGGQQQGGQQQGGQQQGGQQKPGQQNQTPGRRRCPTRSREGLSAGWCARSPPTARK